MAYNETKISKSVSTRELIACGELIADGFTCNEAIDFIVCQKYLNNNQKQNEEEEWTTDKAEFLANDSENKIGVSFQ